ncbi:hypothetical protein LMG19083_05014 [Ralstonia psammae]|uniref:Uncharacterized protein n=1 Tax=Ralstonia psammae TaxID=3058598 RepID=A0ABM9K188_9RALS|nr:hypothetical protein LMG19083_05014 [Ralstonia sp. LMG 19083]
MCADLPMRFKNVEPRVASRLPIGVNGELDLTAGPQRMTQVHMRFYPFDIGKRPKPTVRYPPLKGGNRFLTLPGIQ